jgi:endoglycosylceramidase
MMRGAIIAILLWTASAQAAGSLHVDGQFFRDAQGGAVLLRGVDVAGNSKVPPFEPIGDAKLLDPLPTWGLNVIRLLFTWEAYEPSPGVFDETYLAYYQSVVAAAGARNLYVVVDFHQDAYSRFALQGCGEGFPAWTLPPQIVPATPDNGPSCANWGVRMTTSEDLKAIWTAFYSDANGSRSAYLAMIARVAQALAGESAVVGYDLLNEPGGDEQTEIGPLYEDAARALRAADPSAIIFVSPAAGVSASGISHLAKPTFGNFAFSPHYYDPAVFISGTWKGSDENDPFAAMTGLASSWGVPLFLGEFGASPSTEKVDEYLNALTRQLNLALASSAQWDFTPGWTATAKDGWNLEDFSIVDDHGALRANFRPRPFARRTAGTPLALDVGDDFSDPASNVLSFAWQNDPSAGATELFLPGTYFGGTVALSADGDVHCVREVDLARCASPTAGMKTLRASGPGASCGLTGVEPLLLWWLIWRRRAPRGMPPACGLRRRWRP